MIWILILIVFLTFIFMEGAAWFTHKYVMHGFMWKIHKDHHQRGEGQVLEKNDWFFMIFATPAFLLFLYGTFSANYYAIAIAAGITLYGFCYFLVHDIFIHQRFKWFRNTDNIYLKAIRRAHKIHHKNLYKEGAECFGMLWVPFKYFREALRQSRKAA